MFEYQRLVGAGVKPGIAASVRRALWDEAEVFPNVGRCACLTIEEDRRKTLDLFG